jgi:glucosylceramidase
MIRNPGRSTPRTRALLALWIGVAACGHRPALERGAGAAAPVAQAWITTADQARLLAREPDLPIGAVVDAYTVVIDVDETTAYQEMIGFGAAVTDASAYLIQHKLGTDRDAIVRELFGPDPGIGLSFVRIPMGASDFSSRHYSYDDLPAGQTDPALVRFSVAPDHADKLPVLRAAVAVNPRLSLVASPWSPPAWMKTSGSLIGGTLRPELYPAFAEYFAKFVTAYAAEGIPIHAITLQNEPAFEPPDYPGMRLDPAARARVIGRHLGPLFERRGLRTLILDWDHNWDQPQEPLAVLADSAARRYVSGVAWHCYAGGVGAQDTVHAAHPDKDAYFTECSGGAWAPVFADNLAYDVGTLVIGATRGWARGVALWNLALDETGGPHLGGCGNCRGLITIDSRTGAVTRNVEYYALAHASRFVRPGARRIASTTGVSGLQTVAFRNADDGSRVLIVLNTGRSAMPFDVRDGGRSFRYTLPAGAVVTLRWR